MKGSPRFFQESEVVAPARGLVVDPIDGNFRVVAEQESADRAVSHKKYVTREVSLQDGLHFADNTRLSVFGPLPSPDTRRGVGKKFVGDDFELLGWQEASCGSVVLVHGVPDFQVDT